MQFKLLAIVPADLRIAVGLLTTEDVSRWTQIGLAGLGFVVTLGVVFYDQRNTQFYNNVVGRAEHVEAMLDLTVAGDDPVGGLFINVLCVKGRASELLAFPMGSQTWQQKLHRPKGSLVIAVKASRS